MTRHLRTTGTPPASVRQVLPLSPRCLPHTTSHHLRLRRFHLVHFRFSHSSLSFTFHLPRICPRHTHTPPPYTHHARRHPRMRLAVPRLLILARFVQPAPSSRRSSRSFWGSRRTASSASTSGRWCRGWRKSSTSCAQRRGSLGKGIAIDEYFAFALLGLCTRIHAFTHSTTSSAPIPVSALRVSKHHSHSYFHFHFPLTPTNPTRRARD